MPAENLLSILAAYGAQFPDEADEVAKLVGLVTRGGAQAPAGIVSCFALLLDDNLRVLQRKDHAQRCWQLPGSPAKDHDWVGTAQRALTSWTDVPLSHENGDRVGEAPLHLAIDIDGSSATVSAHYVVPARDDYRELSADVARSARWAPADFLRDGRLVAKLLAHK